LSIILFDTSSTVFFLIHLHLINLSLSHLARIFFFFSNINWFSRHL
jgi:hypothetical protein